MKKNIRLYKNPNPNNDNQSYLIPKVYVDSIDSFDTRRLNWQFHKNDKRKVKRIKKKKNV